jgi:tripartite-type tricarboxylate transporter receptor subunit TctC
VLTAFVPVAMVGHGPMLLAVSAATPIKSPGRAGGRGQGQPGSVKYGTSGTGLHRPHEQRDAVSDAAGMQMLHVPYKGAHPTHCWTWPAAPST